VVAGFCSRLKIRDIVDEACPVRDLAELSHGQVIEALVADRLTCPAPLVHVQAWATGWAVGVEPELLDDDRIGRPLDAIAAHLDRIVEPFIWTKTAEEILDSLASFCRRISGAGH